MKTLAECLQTLPQRHQNALGWFLTRRGTIHPWPAPLADGTLLAAKPKGIYKPAWSRYALSVRENFGSDYRDKEPVSRPDGTWLYRYFQENANPQERDREFANRGLLQCRDDAVPVGVMRQVSSKRPCRYAILGVAYVRSWEEGYFLLEGFNSKGMARG